MQRDCVNLQFTMFRHCILCILCVAPFSQLILICTCDSIRGTLRLITLAALKLLWCQPTGTTASNHKSSFCPHRFQSVLVNGPSLMIRHVHSCIFIIIDIGSKYTHTCEWFIDMQLWSDSVTGSS